jgi:hypothetical protein
MPSGFLGYIPFFSIFFSRLCQPTKIHGRIHTVFGNACVTKTVVELCQKFGSVEQGTSSEAQPGQAHIIATPGNVAKVERGFHVDRCWSICPSMLVRDIMLHNSAHHHVAHTVQDMLCFMCWEVLRHPPFTMYLLL